MLHFKWNPNIYEFIYFLLLEKRKKKILFGFDFLKDICNLIR